MFAVPAAHASGDAPWCTVSQIGEGAEAWDCQYETVQECGQNIPLHPLPPRRRFRTTIL
jgi:hypothetical protein